MSEFRADPIEATRSESDKDPIIADLIVPPRQPWSGIVRRWETLRLIDVEGQQAVDFLCYDAGDPSDRYSATNTVKAQGNLYLGLGTVLYSDRGVALFTITEDSIGKHDTVYGCCSNVNNMIRYGAVTTQSCYTNFLSELAKRDLDASSIVSNINFFMQVPILPDGSAGVAEDVSPPGSHVSLRAECDVLVVLSNCPQMHNACNAYNPTPIRVTIFGAPMS